MTDILKDIIEALSMYSSEYLIPTYLAENPNYQSENQKVERSLTALQELLTPEGQKLLENFKAAVDRRYWIELDANFRAGLVIGLNLARM